MAEWHHSNTFFTSVLDVTSLLHASGRFTSGYRLNEEEEGRLGGSQASLGVF